MAMYPDSNPSRMSSQTMQQQTYSVQENMPAAIVTRDLVRLFGQKAAVNHLNLTVRRGEFFGFLGPNGAGKSTTIKMMVGLLRPTSGSVWVGGVDVWKEPLQARSLMGVLPEYLNIYERLSGREFLVFAGHMYGVPNADIRRRAEELLQVLTLADDADKLIVDYSVGMRKKTALAAALIHRPQVLFLDEPFEGTPLGSIKSVTCLLAEVATRGGIEGFGHLAWYNPRGATQIKSVKVLVDDLGRALLGQDAGVVVAVTSGQLGAEQIRGAAGDLAPA